MSCNFTDLLISSNSFLMYSIGFSIYKIIFLQIKAIPLLSFWFEGLLFLFLCYTILNRSGLSGCPSCLISDLSGKAFNFHCWVGCKLWASYQWPSLHCVMFLPYAVCQEILSCKKLYFVKWFFCIYWDDHMIFISYLLMCVSHLLIYLCWTTLISQG